MDIARYLANKYEERFKEHGDSHLALGWRNPESAQKRYEVMFDIVQFYPASILDWGCGLAHFYDYIQQFPARKHVTYHGMDESHVLLAECRKKHPHLTFYHKEDYLPLCDYVVMNGLFTEKLDVPWGDFWEYAQLTIEDAWRYTTVALAVNFMSTHLDYERDDLFYLPLDTLADFLHHKLSRKFRIRHDYLWEYTAYVYR